MNHVRLGRSQANRYTKTLSSRNSSRKVSSCFCTWRLVSCASSVGKMWCDVTVPRSIFDIKSDFVRLMSKVACRRETDGGRMRRELCSEDGGAEWVRQ